MIFFLLICNPKKEGSTCVNRNTFQESNSNVAAINCTETWVDKTCNENDVIITNNLGTYGCGIASDSLRYYANIQNENILQERTAVTTSAFGGSDCGSATIRGKTTSTMLNVNSVNCEFGP